MECYELTTSHIPHPPALLSGAEEVENWKQSSDTN